MSLEFGLGGKAVFAEQAFAQWLALVMFPVVTAILVVAVIAGPVIYRMIRDSRAWKSVDGDWVEDNGLLWTELERQRIGCVDEAMRTLGFERVAAYRSDQMARYQRALGYVYLEYRSGDPTVVGTALIRTFRAGFRVVASLVFEFSVETIRGRYIVCNSMGNWSLESKSTSARGFASVNDPAMLLEALRRIALNAEELAVAGPASVRRINASYTKVVEGCVEKRQAELSADRSRYRARWSEILKALANFTIVVGIWRQWKLARESARVLAGLGFSKRERLAAKRHQLPLCSAPSRAAPR